MRKHSIKVWGIFCAISIGICGCSMQQGSSNADVSGTLVESQTVILYSEYDQLTGGGGSGSELLFDGDLRIQLMTVGEDIAHIKLKSPTIDEVDVLIEVGDSFIYQGRNYTYKITAIEAVPDNEGLAGTITTHTASLEIEAYQE